MTQHILIAGAGIAGLCTAIALMQRGFRVTIFEQAETLRETGAGVQISPNGTRGLASLGVLDAVRDLAVEPAAKTIRLWNSGETWSLFDLGSMSVAEYGFPYLMVHRGDLQTTLVNAVIQHDPSAIRQGAGVVAVDDRADGVTVSLSNGQRIEGDILIGADGIHSAVRAAVFGAGPAHFTGCVAWRGVIPSSRLPSHIRLDIGTNWVGPGRHVVTYPLRRGELFNFVGVVERSGWETESWTAKGTREECAGDFTGWHPDVHVLIDNIDVHYRWALMSRPPMEQWSKRRVVLVGDACHPMLPFMAQGAVMAIEDAVTLARCLAVNRGDHGAAFLAYEQERVTRANRCVVEAEHNRNIFHNERLMNAEDAVHYVSSQWNETKVRNRYHWLFSYDAVSNK
ncbi:MAG: monooxygenase [Bradyrhizobiaceae bacterium PARB1]|nr:MAG: monooxygenase [Bradyrhizobiaceae bacterium PARB1]